MAIIAGYCTLALIFGHTLVLPNNNDLSTCLAKSNFTLENDTLYFVNEGLNEEWVTTAQEENKTIIDNPSCTLIENKNYT